MFDYLTATVTATIEQTRTFLQSRVAASSDRMAAALETVAVLASPAVLYAGLRLRGMGPVQLVDPSIHTTYILDPSDIFVRYQALFTPSSRLREAARVGFLVPARVAYLLFGAVPGFFVFRYVLALVAIVPVYLLLKKLYGRWAGFVGIAVVMSSPVVLTAWGTDYPDSAAVSYLTGGLAALALSLEGRPQRPGWLLVAAGLLTMAAWAHGISVPLVIVLVVVYVGVRLARERAQLGRDLALLVVSAIVATGVLAICSKLLFDQFDFITPTVKAARYLSSPHELSLSHSASWGWAQYDLYLLVPPAILAAFVVVFARRWRNIGTSQLFVGLAGALQLAAFVFLQFFNHVEALEMHFFSSTLWSSVNIMLAMTLAEVTRPIVERGDAEGSHSSAAELRATGRVQVGRWVACAVPAFLVLAVALAYQVDPHVPAMTWAPWGAAVAAIVVAAAVVGRLTIDWTKTADRQRSTARLAPDRVVSAVAAVVMTGSALLLTVAPGAPHRPIPHTVRDPIPAYSRALGGNDTPYVSEYTVVSELPGFVGRATYRGEQLETWAPVRDFGPLLGPMGIYHGAFNLLTGSFPSLDAFGVHKLEFRRIAQVLLMSTTGDHFAQAVRSLAPYQPVVVRRGVLSDGSYHLHVWLVDIGRYIRRTSE